MVMKLDEHKAFRAIIEEQIEPIDTHLESDDVLYDWLMRGVSTAQHIPETFQDETGIGPNGGC